MKIRTIAYFAMPVIILLFVFLFPTKETKSNRENPTQSTELPTSNLKDEARFAIETRAEDITTVETKTLLDGSGDREVLQGDIITVNYRGWLATDGSIFDQSFNRGDSGFNFTVGNGVIAGWSEGVEGMKIGEVRRLYIPSEKGYGESGNGSSIPANADLIFDVELLKFD